MTEPRNIRVVVVEDSPTVRARIVETLSAEPGFEVVGETGDGLAAIELCMRIRPDVATLDMVLDTASGLEVTEALMARAPMPILIVSSSVNRAELFQTCDALAAGALDVLEKPNGHEPEGEWEKRLVASVRTISRIKVITHLRGKLRTRDIVASPVPARAPDSVPTPDRAVGIVAIGASTGGPAAILETIRAFPRDFPVPVAAVLHIGGPFGAAMTEWLGEAAGRRVQTARHGDRLAPGVVFMAPPDSHMAIRGGRIRLSDDPPRHSCRPSVDVLFESIADEFGPRAAACLLTGMGRDGAAGLLRIRRAGGLSIAQDEATCVVYGMPREAARIGAAERILPLGEIGPALAAVGSARREGVR